ncbi:Chromosome segregation ATPase OS=Streptomyces albaduncus OX=68172 GN=FHS32_006674 PE=4 SV=1 [Streptomyces griseoloalbus]
MLRHRAAADRVARVSAAIQEAERDAAPALAARAKAAVDLVRALHAAARNAENLANEEEERSAALQEAGDAAYRDSTAAATEAQRARSEIGHLRQRLAEVEQETAEAVRAGWLDDSAPDADPARAALAASDAEKTAVAAWDTARETARRATEHARETAAAESRAELTAARAADAATAAERAHEGERRTAEGLAAEQRLAELLSLPGASGTRRRAVPGQRTGSDGAADGTREGGLSAEELDRFADELRELLDDAVTSAERQLFELRTAAADDARILGALGDGGLLPPGPDVLATVEFLGEHGIPALPGWRYLAQAVDPADHARVLAARPELVDGVVITDPDSHARAREALNDAALLPRSAVAVGTAAALLAPTPPPASGSGDVFLVPPNPAMHDEHAADEERQALRARAAERDEEIRALAARLGKDRELAARLASWRTGCPAGRLAELAATAEQARAFAEETEAELAEARSLRAEAEEAAAEAVRVRDERQEAAQKARRAADALAGLAFRLRERAGWQAKLRELADDAAEAEARAQSCLERARAADEDRRAAQRAADDARRTARTLRAERSEIAGAPDDLPEDGDGAPQASLPALREAYRAASQVYEKVGVGADLRAEQARAESDESAARAELDRLSNKVRTRAEQLLQSPDGSDGPSRQAAAARAEELVQLLETRMSGASEQLGRLRGEAERLAPADGEAHTELPEELVPRDAEHAQALLRTATGELATREEELRQAREAHAELLAAHRAAEDAAGGFDEIAAMLRDLLREHTAEEEPERPEPYPGDLDDARRSAAEARRSLRGCAADLSAAEAAVREASDVLVRHANSTRYEQVRTPARQQIRELPAAALPEHAKKWADAFAPRLRVLTDELAQLERNRDSIVDRLRGLVESALATLRSAQRLSRLPEGLGEWSGQEFLRIRFEEPDQATLTERLGEVVDEATRAAVKKNSDLRRDGMSLLLRGVAAALRPKGVAVEILKPDAVLRAERVPVGQMGDVFSGGQLLTAAIALYCTMAALRSNDRGRDKHRHAGTLFLDNPIGRANATYLLELQRAVADALGVQLLYTTGLFDTTALAEFPLVIRLRNDADLRAGLKYISVEEHLRPGLPTPDPGEEAHSEITATRMYKRPAPTS